MTFGVGRTHDLLNTEEVAKDKKHLTRLLPRADVGNVSLSFFQRSTSCCRFFFFLSFYELPVGSSACLSPHAG